MRHTIFFDVDTQFDFMRKGGKLYVPDAESIIPNLKKITKFARSKKIRVIASADKHSLSDWEISSETFPPHCMRGTKGQRKISETRLRGYAPVPSKKLSKKEAEKLKRKNILLVEKQEYAAFSNPNLKELLKGTEKAYVYGVATDYCVKAAVLGLREMGIETFVIKDAIKPVFKKNEKKDLALFRRKGAKFLTTERLLRLKVL